MLFISDCFNKCGARQTFKFCIYYISKQFSEEVYKAIVRNQITRAWSPIAIRRLNLLGFLLGKPNNGAHWAFHELLRMTIEQHGVKPSLTLIFF